MDTNKKNEFATRNSSGIETITAGKIDVSPEGIKRLREWAEFWNKILKPSMEEKKALCKFYEKHCWLYRLSLCPILGKLFRKICIRIALNKIYR